MKNTNQMAQTVQAPAPVKIFVHGALTCIDFVHPATGLGMYGGQSLEELQAKYPGAVIADLKEWEAAKETALTTEPKPIDEERFMEMLEALPPQNWQQNPGCNSFEMSEHYSGRITSIFARVDGKFWEFQGIAGTPQGDIVRLCSRARLFAGNYPEGIVYADKRREKSGDYARLGFLSYRTLKLDLKTDCPRGLRALVVADAAAIQARRGEFYRISSCGQGVTLGGAQ